jgi:hypothetical protein
MEGFKTLDFLKNSCRSVDNLGTRPQKISAALTQKECVYCAVQNWY